MFRELLEKISLYLEKNGIEDMLIGGQAVLLYGEPRLTRDIDITLNLGPEKVTDILDIVNEFPAFELLCYVPNNGY